MPNTGNRIQQQILFRNLFPYPSKLLTHKSYFSPHTGPLAAAHYALFHFPRSTCEFTSTFQPRNIVE